MNTMAMFELDSFPVMLDPKKVNNLNDDFYIFNDVKSMPIYETPTRLETSVLSVCLSGYSRIGINMQEYYVGPGALMVALRDQIIHSIEISDDYHAIIIAISRNYTDEILPKVKVMLPLFFYTKEYPCLNLQGNELNYIMEYYNMFGKG